MYEIFERLLQKEGIKAIDVSKATGIHRSVFSDWKSGRAKPKMDKLKKIADFFGVSLDYLCYGKTDNYYTNEETGRIAQDIFENGDLKALFDLASDSTPEDIKTAYSVLLALNESRGKK